MAFLALGTLDIQAQKLAIPENPSNNLILHNIAGDTTIFKIDNSEIMRLTKSGRLGIGVAPSYTLDLFSSDYVVSRFKRSGMGGAVFRLENGNNYSWEFGMGSNGEFGINKSGDALGSQFFIKNNGNVGIGTTSPSAKIHVAHNGHNGSGGLSEYGILAHSTSGQATLGAIGEGDIYANLNLGTNVAGKKKFWHISKRTSAESHALKFFFYDEDTGGFHDKITINSNGNVNVHGTVSSNGSVLSSDARFKKDIQTLTTSKVAKLDQVRGTSYQFRTKEFKDKNFAKGTQMGVIAQELIKVYPELVSKGKDGYYSVNYTGLIPVLVEAVKDLRKKNGELKANVKQLQDKAGQIEEVKAQNKSLEARLAALEKLLLKAKK